MTPKESCEKEVQRFFKKYYMFTASSDSDLLNELLGSLCSSVEKFEKFSKVKFSKGNALYVAIKALRNFSVHESELLNSSKAINPRDIPNVHAELHLLCLLPRKTIDRILDGKVSDYTKESINNIFIFYENYVDIYPAIFNFAVDLYFLCVEYGLSINGSEFDSMKNSITYEIQNGFSHHVSGKIVGLNGVSASKYIDKYAVSLEERYNEMNQGGENEFGMHHVNALHTTSPMVQFNLLSKEEKSIIFQQLVDSKSFEYNDKIVGGVTIKRALTPIEHLVMKELASRNTK